MTDDVIKLREAMYKAEPFLTYMVAEGEAPRNNTVLIDALNGVREALGMKPHVPAKQSKQYAVDDLLDRRIVVEELVEHEDGSATMKISMTKDSAELLLHIGFSTLLKDVADKLK